MPQFGQNRRSPPPILDHRSIFPEFLGILNAIVIHRVTPTAMSFSLEILAFPILTNRARYYTCFITIPDEAKPIAGIEVIGKFYSFARFCPDQDQAFETTSRLLDRQRLSIITQTPKGYVVWRWEPKAVLVTDQTHKTKAPEGFCKVLRTQVKVPTCEIQVPDLDKPLTAIRVSGQFYALLKAVPDESAAIALGTQMSQWGDRILVTPKRTGFALWIYEAEAQLRSPQAAEFAA